MPSLMLCIGNQTSCWTATPSEPFEYALARGFGAFEWFPDKKPGAGWDETDLDSNTRQAIRERAQAVGLRLSVHARWQANPFREDGALWLSKDLELARDLGAVLLNIHLMDEQGPEAFVRAILPLIRRTADAGIQLSIENTPHHSPEEFNALFDRLREQGPPATAHVGMCLDLGHANLCSATRNDYLAFCDHLGPQVPIIHLHLHENWGDSDSHLPLFTGPAGQNDSGIRGLLERLKKRRYSGAAILEQWPHPPELLDQARERLLRLWANDGERSKAKSAPEDPKPSPTLATELASVGFAAELATADRGARSWREKLEAVLRLLADDRRHLTEDELAYVCIYLRFLGTGEITCMEDGRHFRPGNHARLASQIRERLAGLTTPENGFLLRKIYPWLPSSAASFQRAEPLTRIRDIAHRNDIDQALKREIKTTLQNKLHRCAGPEDLVTATRLLERITAPGANYPEDFVQQFRVFLNELKEFFNAQSLDQRLEALRPSLGKEHTDLIARFLEEKSGKGSRAKLDSLRTLTLLRRLCSGRATPQSGVDWQESLLTDIALEDFAFVLLSEFINSLESTSLERAWKAATDALLLSLENLELSGFAPEEAHVLQRELGEWTRTSPLELRDDLLRLYGTILRCRRLVENFSERLVALFSERAAQLGRRLGVAEHAIRVFSEADLRSHVIFQSSKLVSGLLRQIREHLKLPPWDVLVCGRALGRVVSARTLEEFRDGKESAENPADLVLVLLASAAGDEEIPRNVSGIILAHELPHLSHLGVRARQAGVVFVTCETPGELDRFRCLEGKAVSLLALPNSVSWEETDLVQNLSAKLPPAQLGIPKVEMSPERTWIPLERALPENSGGKACGARRLAELSREDETRFLTPRSLLIPFGVMEAALGAAPGLSKEYQELSRSLANVPSGEVPGLARKLRNLVQKLGVPEAITGEIRKHFGSGTGLIVRSSANCEDLEELAGAGLYDSVINVDPDNVQSAVRSVWASLWTERASASRQNMGIPHAEAHMAVLVQELIDAELSFVLHTVNPVSLNPREVYLEIVVGLGETLVSAATRGSPYRLVCDKDSGNVVTLEFANFSQADRPNPGAGVRRETVDYSQVVLSRDLSTREQLGRRLCSLGCFIEKALGSPQDIEGAIVGDRIYLVQARPQTGLKGRGKQ